MEDENNTPNPSVVPLTESEVRIELIHNSLQMNNNAKFIFYTFLKRYPHNQVKFASFKNTPLTDLKGKPRFRAHVSRIIGVFNSVVESLVYDLDDIFAHAKRKITKKTHIELRLVLMEILSSICNLNEEGIAAWNKLLDIFYFVMFECIDGRGAQFE